MDLDFEDFEESYDLSDETFVRGNVEISSSGVSMRNNPKSFELLYEDLEIGEMIGRGASGIVLHAFHRPSRTPLALKVMNTFEKEKRDQLFREICTLYDAECASLIGFYGAFYREGTISIALEYMDGGSLANLVHQLGPIPEEVLASIVFQVLWALGYLHHEKRVHRDIKPSNILINSQGEVKVSDFGISAQLANSIAMCGTFVGTFKFMSPERIQHEPYGYASDIWSLGLSILECVTGQYPYPEEEEEVAAIDLVQMILESDPPSLRHFEGFDFSMEIEDFVDSCLQKDPDQRKTAEELLSSPFMAIHGAYSYEEAVQNVKDWIDCLHGK